MRAVAGPGGKQTEDRRGGAVFPGRSILRFVIIGLVPMTHRSASSSSRRVAGDKRNRSVRLEGSAGARKQSVVTVVRIFIVIPAKAGTHV